MKCLEECGKQGEVKITEVKEERKKTKKEENDRNKKSSRRMGNLE